MLALMTPVQRLNMLADVFTNFTLSIQENRDYDKQSLASSETIKLTHGREFVLKHLCINGFPKNTNVVKLYNNTGDTVPAIINILKESQIPKVVSDSLLIFSDKTVDLVLEYAGIVQNDVSPEIQEINKIRIQIMQEEKKIVQDDLERINKELGPPEATVSFMRPKRKSPKRKSPKRKSPKRKSPKRKSPKRKSPKRKSPKRSSSKRKSRR
jgi:hypothetical protein